eukprot:TRINITY_DN1050_c0_g1_i1.p1 TRINITY_DN1050_c0_g1~~TRINITY_DN1050_c0_g1_i1.p1  ORF type:complete len:853 (-),score=266.69 TRINITY_DN1050_c0_g1_i1:483-3041(-)
MAQTLEQRRGRRQQVLNELISSERTYLESLKKALRVFRDELVSKGESVLPRTDVDVLFGNLQGIVVANDEFMRDISSKEGDRQALVLNALSKHCSDGHFFDAYCAYIMRYPTTTDLLSIICQPKHPFMEWYNERAEQCGILQSISSFLVMPVQRIPRYLLFVQELFKYSREDDEHYKDIRKTMVIVEEFASQMNETKRQLEKSTGIMKVLGIKASSLLMAEGPMIYEQENVGMGGLVTHKSVHAFLFHDVLAVAKCDISGRPTHLQWHVELINADIQETETGRFVVSEVRRIKTYPFIYIASYVLVASHPPHDDSFWRAGFDAAMESFWRDESKKINLSKAMDKHMTENLLTEEDWALLSIGGETKEYNEGDYVVRHGQVNESLFLIERGSVSVMVPAPSGHRQDKMVVASLGSGEIFGELSMLSRDSVTATADIVAAAASKNKSDTNKTTATAIPFVLLNSTLLKRPELGMRFFQLVCFKLATRFVNQPLKEALRKEEEQEQKQHLAPAARKLTAGSIRERSAELLRCTTNDSLETLRRSGPSSSEECRSSSPVRRSHLDEAMAAKRAKVLKKLGLPDETVAACYGVRTDKKLAGDFFIMRRHLGFRGTFFRKAVNVVITQESVTSIAAKDSMKITVCAGGKQHVFTFRTADERQEALGILMNFKPVRSDMLQLLSTPGQRTSCGSAPAPRLNRIDSVELTDEGWINMLEAASVTTYDKDEVIISHGDRPLTLFQLSKGSARVEVPPGGGSDKGRAADAEGEAGDAAEGTESNVVGRMECGEIFGEVSFVLGSLATANVLADEDDTEVVCFTRNTVAELFRTRPDLGAGFYHFLSVKMRDLFLKVEAKAQS